MFKNKALINNERANYVFTRPMAAQRLMDGLPRHPPFQNPLRRKAILGKMTYRNYSIKNKSACVASTSGISRPFRLTTCRCARAKSFCTHRNSYRMSTNSCSTSINNYCASENNYCTSRNGYPASDNSYCTLRNSFGTFANSYRMSEKSCAAFRNNYRTSANSYRTFKSSLRSFTRTAWADMDSTHAHSTRKLSSFVW